MSIADHEALASYALPMGPRPVPNGADRKSAEQLFAEAFGHRSDLWIARNRDKYVDQLAVAEMQKRQHRERKEQPARKAAA